MSSLTHPPTSTSTTTSTSPPTLSQLIQQLHTARLQQQWDTCNSLASTILAQPISTPDTTIAHALAHAYQAYHTLHIVHDITLTQSHLQQAISFASTHPTIIILQAEYELHHDQYINIIPSSPTYDQLSRAYTHLQRLTSTSIITSQDQYEYIKGLVMKGEIGESIDKNMEAADAYTKVWEFVSTMNPLPSLLTPLILIALTSLPRALLACHRTEDALRIMHLYLINTPQNITNEMRDELCIKYAMWMERAISATDYRTVMSSPSVQASLPKNVPIPRSSLEEALLLLLVQQAQGEKSIVASSTPSSSISTLTTRELSLALTPTNEYDAIVDNERAHLSQHLEDVDGWYRLCMALMSAQQYEEAFVAAQECIARRPDHVLVLLMASKLCHNFLGKHHAAVHYSKLALRAITAANEKEAAQQDTTSTTTLAINTSAPTSSAPTSSAPSTPVRPHLLAIIPSTSRDTSPTPSPRKTVSSSIPSTTSDLSHTHPPFTSSSLYLSTSLYTTCQTVYGVCSSIYAYHVSTFNTRKSLQKRALAALQAAHARSPNNRQTAFHLACLYADIREISSSLALVKTILSADRYHLGAWHLLALLLSAQKKYTAAISACESGMAQRSVTDCHALLLTKARLLSHQGELDQAIATFNELLLSLFPAASTASSTSASTSAPPIMFVPYGNGKLRRPVVILKKQSQSGGSQSGIVTSQSDGKQNTNGVTPTSVTPFSDVSRSDPLTTFRITTLLELSRLYTTHSSHPSLHPDDSTFLADAMDCCYAACEYTSSTSDIHAQLGAICALQGNDVDAQRHYQSALALDAHHIPSMVALAAIENQNPSGSLILAHGHLRSALQVDATCHTAWLELSSVVSRQGDINVATEHALTALELERTAPIMSFHTVARRL